MARMSPIAPSWTRSISSRLGRIVAVAEAGDDRQVLLLGLFGRSPARCARPGRRRPPAFRRRRACPRRWPPSGARAGNAAAWPGSPRRRRWRAVSGRRRSRRMRGPASTATRSEFVVFRFVEACLQPVGERVGHGRQLACSDRPAKALPAAPVPRPPQPIRPIFSVSLPAACAGAADQQIAGHRGADDRSRRMS